MTDHATARERLRHCRVRLSRNVSIPTWYWLAAAFALGVIWAHWEVWV